MISLSTIITIRVTKMYFSSGLFASWSYLHCSRYDSKDGCSWVTDDLRSLPCWAAYYQTTLSLSSILVQTCWADVTCPLIKERPLLPVGSKLDPPLSLSLSFISSLILSNIRSTSIFFYFSFFLTSRRAILSISADFMLSLCDLIKDSILLRHSQIRGVLLHMRDSPIAAKWDRRGRMSRAGNAAYLYLTSMNLDCGLGFWLAGKCLYTGTPG